MRNLLSWGVLAIAAIATFSFFAALGAGWVMLWGWVTFLTYRSFAPESWPSLGLWTATGIVLLAMILLRSIQGGVTKA
jgi:hypothetical protein